MKEFVLRYLDGKVRKLSAPSLSVLKKDHFQNSDKKLKEIVKNISWSTGATYYTRNVQTGETKAELISADVNPFGWRNA